MAELTTRLAGSFFMSLYLPSCLLHSPSTRRTPEHPLARTRRIGCAALLAGGDHHQRQSCPVVQRSDPGCPLRLLHGELPLGGSLAETRYRNPVTLSWRKFNRFKCAEKTDGYIRKVPSFIDTPDCGSTACRFWSPSIRSLIMRGSGTAVPRSVI